jgi:hypothetical protein
VNKFALFAAAVLLGFEAHAASVMKCVDAAGKVTFTQNANCPSNTGLTDVVSAHNAAPSGSSVPVQMADPTKLPPKPQKSEGQSFTVVGERPAPVATVPAVKSEPVPPVVVRSANQPCVRVVEQPYSYSKPGKNGGTVGVAGIRKVVVPC